MVALVLMLRYGKTNQLRVWVPGGLLLSTAICSGVIILKSSFVRRRAGFKETTLACLANQIQRVSCTSKWGDVIGNELHAGE